MNIDFMKRAIELSKEKMEEGCGGPFGAVIVKNNEIIAEGWNQVTSTNDPTAHAEVVAIRKACNKLKNYDLKNCEIYTSCEPCPMCIGAIYWARPDKIYYVNTRKDAKEAGFDDDFIYKEISKDVKDKKIPMIQIKELYDDAKMVMKEWETKTDKVAY